jgi:hypothetical protein
VLEEVGKSRPAYFLVAGSHPVMNTHMNQRDSIVPVQQYRQTITQAVFFELDLGC